jgi:hypothetical protein
MGWLIKRDFEGSDSPSSLMRILVELIDAALDGTYESAWKHRDALGALPGFPMAAGTLLSGEIDLASRS